jgi:hypothetical protein
MNGESLFASGASHCATGESNCSSGVSQWRVTMARHTQWHSNITICLVVQQCTVLLVGAADAVHVLVAIVKAATDVTLSLRKR